MNKAVNSDQSFGFRKMASGADQNAAVMSDIELRKMSIERDAKRRKLMWDEALRLARSGDYPDALAVESELTSMGYTEAKHAFSEQDIRQIEVICGKFAGGSAKSQPAEPAIANDIPNGHGANGHAFQANDRPEPAGVTGNGSDDAAADGGAADGAAANGGAANGAATNGAAVNGARVNGAAMNGVAPNGSMANGAAAAPVRAQNPKPAGIGRLAQVSAAEVWGEGAPDLAGWLAENPDIATDVLGFTLANAERKRAAEGAEFGVADDSSGRRVLVESRIGETGDGQLGTLVANLAASGAQAAVWLVSEARPEHERAIAWLNDSSTCSFYLVKLEAVRIGNSDPAPVLSLIAGPTEQRLTS
jgi:hypothetical protein